MPPKTHLPDALPLREELEALAHRYLHLHNEVEQRNAGSGVRRRIEDELLRVRERFDTLLGEWVPDDELRERWREYLHTHAAEPEQPEAIDPLVFRGVNEAGSVADVRRRGDEFLVSIDGALVERVAADEDFRSPVPGARFRVDGFDFRETITASPDAVRALAEYLDDEGAHPPWDYASLLLGDGLVDAHFGLTPRGRRALAALDV
jgi:hypothetical protein